MAATGITHGCTREVADKKAGDIIRAFRTALYPYNCRGDPMMHSVAQSMAVGIEVNGRGMVCAGFLGMEEGDGIAMYQEEE